MFVLVFYFSFKAYWGCNYSVDNYKNYRPINLSFFKFIKDTITPKGYRLVALFLSPLVRQRLVE